MLEKIKSIFNNKEKRIENLISFLIILVITLIVINKIIKDKDMRYTEKEMKDNAIGIMNNYNESIDRDYEQELFYF